ncbi:MAG: hypothetical protein IPK22_12600 [Verrucomicrobiaceae bacterium]|nr:hypothetical protein [Verrucomicrobiaceae bacterium]
MNESSPSPKRSRWKAVLLLGLVFVLGAACGIGGGLFVLRRVVHRAITDPQSDRTPVDLVIAALERDVSSELDLDDAQRHQLHQSLQITVKDFKGLRIEVWQKAREKARESLERIASQLPPEKAARLREHATSRLKPWGLLE